ncbi:TetR/AcrR family transcriptional regulator [Mycolicibacterium houstonense]|uniref:TetR/AcrR family transcriptional regulator n=1 Tax=Mycolicibacterium houstonense TaxID=146021 RepID=UPI00083370EE|nr:TetR/AcrR family transcriptional regulator [Mycolicibacterium houstonense]
MTDVRPPSGEAALERGPDPRVMRSRQAALSAVRELLAEEGWTGVTHVAVAARSGVGRTTLYRHWPDVGSLIHDAIVERIGEARTARTGQLRTDLLSEVNGLRRLLHDPAAAHTMRAVLERSPFDPVFASLRNTLYHSGSAGFRTILETAASDGDLRPDTDIDLVIDQLAGPLVYRRLFAGRDIDEEYVQTVVDSVLQVHGAVAAPRRGRRRKG